MYKIKTRTYECNICKKKYASSGSLWCHNKKFHKNKTELVQSDIILDVNNNSFSNEQVQITTELVQNNNEQILNINKNYIENSNHNIDITKNNNNYQINKSLTCEYCNKKFNCRSSKSMHKKTCKSNINILEEYNKLKEENEKLKNNLNSIGTNTNNTNTSNAINTNIYNTNSGIIGNYNKINNGIINNLVVNHIGSEKIDFNAKQIKSIVSRDLNGVVKCIKKLNFNKKKPENHSFCSSSLAAPYCKAINYKTQKPEIVAKTDIVDMVLESSFRMLEGISIQIDCNNELKNEFTKKELKKLENLIASKPKFYESKNKKSFYKSINMMSYNYKNLIMSTWELLNPIEQDNNNDNNNNSDTDWSNLKDMSDFADSSDEEDNELSESSNDEDDKNILLLNF